LQGNTISFTTIVDFQGQMMTLTNPSDEHTPRNREPRDRFEDFRLFEESDKPESLGRLGHFEVLKVLGRGGFGLVVKAFDTKLHRDVAIKLLSDRIGPNSTTGVRFIREARATATIRHENVVQIYAVEEKPNPYIVMEYVPGYSLQELIERRGTLTAKETCQIISQVARGLGAAHDRGLVHRDLKPANILIEKIGEEYRAKLADFGLAITGDETRLTQSGMIVGTPVFMAPEQTRGEELDLRSDLFSLGGVLYVMLTGTTPFGSSEPMVLLNRINNMEPVPLEIAAPDTPRWLCRIVMKLLSKQRSARYQTALEVAELLEKGSESSVKETEATFVSPKPVDHELPSTIELPVHSRKRFAALVGGLALIAITAMAGFFLLSPRRGPETMATSQGSPTTTPETPNNAPAIDIRRLLTSTEYSWTAPEVLPGEINSHQRTKSLTLTEDERHIIFAREWALWSGSRIHASDEFSDFKKLPKQLHEMIAEMPSLSSDGKVLAFTWRKDPNSQTQAMIARRDSVQKEFGLPQALREEKPGNFDHSPVLSHDADFLLTVCHRPGYAGLHEYRRSDQGYGSSKPLPFIEMPPGIALSWISRDRLVLLGTQMSDGTETLIAMTRETDSKPFGTPFPLRGFENIRAARPWLSADGRRIYFHSSKGEGSQRRLQLYMSRLVKTP
jgi:serine/threonine protein kinase